MATKKDEILNRIADLRNIQNAMMDNNIRGQVKLKYSTATGEGDFEFIGMCDVGIPSRPVDNTGDYVNG